jgi:hypothetical protein
MNWLTESQQERLIAASLKPAGERASAIDDVIAQIKEEASWLFKKEELGGLR